MALASKGPSQTRGTKEEKDLSKVRCFRCGEFSHYSMRCPLKKEDKLERQDQATTSAETDKLSSRFESWFKRELIFSS